MKEAIFGDLVAPTEKLEGFVTAEGIAGVIANLMHKENSVSLACTVSDLIGRQIKIGKLKQTDLIKSKILKKGKNGKERYYAKIFYSLRALVLVVCMKAPLEAFDYIISQTYV